MPHFVVVGGGQAGASLCATLRNSGFDGDVTLICEEPEPPYQRPPLSKAYLLGEMERERLYLRPESFYTEHNITLRLNTKVSSIDPAAKTLMINDEPMPYDQLALTTGSAARELPAAIGGQLDGVFTVRSLADVDSMAHAFKAGGHLLVIGGGYIGLEAAAVARKLGLQVTLIEMAERILQRVAAPQTSDFFRTLHAAKGVEIRESIGLERLVGETKVNGAKLTDGTELIVDFVVVGIGIAPNSGLAESAGLLIENGIRTDQFGRTSDPNIWASGDCASFPLDGHQIRLESVQNAIDQSECVAKNMMGEDTAYIPKPWFWSDQYDTKLQIAGLNTGYTRVIARQSDEAESFWYYKNDQFIAVDAMNDPRAFMVGKRLLDMGKSPDPGAVADPATDLKTLMRG
ncbi:MAG: FAD-dependent oxidoreductase [Pseudomonadota bacterium]